MYTILYYNTLHQTILYYTKARMAHGVPAHTPAPHVPPESDARLIYMYIYIYIYVYEMYNHMYICICIYVCIHLSLSLSLYVYIYTYVYAHILLLASCSPLGLKPPLYLYLHIRISPLYCIYVCHSAYTYIAAILHKHLYPIWCMQSATCYVFVYICIYTYISKVAPPVPKRRP